MANVARNLLSVIALTLAVINPALADVTLTRSPTSINIPLGQPTTITVTWTLTPGCFSPTPPATGTVSSPNGVLQIGQTQVSIGSGFSRVMSTGGPPVTFVDTALIPASVSTQAVKAGIGTITYSRTFASTNNCTSPSSSDSVTLPITSSSAASFGVSRLALSFDNGASVRVLERKQSLRANAEVHFNGNGMLQGQWEVATPASTAGEPMFRSISTVSQYMIGSDTQTVPSPTLPTDTAGLYLLRLRLTEPSSTFDTPVIRYFVTDPQTAARVPAVPLAILSPPNQALLAPSTMFAWDAIPRARAYQIEIYAKPRVAGDTLPDLGTITDSTPRALPTTPPVTGMLVNSTQTRTALSETARAHLLSGQKYLWRVVAIGANGNFVGEGPVREFSMP